MSLSNNSGIFLGQIFNGGEFLHPTSLIWFIMDIFQQPLNCSNSLIIHFNGSLIDMMFTAFNCLSVLALHSTSKNIKLEK